MSRVIVIALTLALFCAGCNIADDVATPQFPDDLSDSAPDADGRPDLPITPDAPPDAPLDETIRVMGWASNFAQIYDAIKEYKKRERSRKTDQEPLSDAFWGVNIPNPLPVKGAKVTVKGNYATTFTKATTGVVSDPLMGVMTYDSIEYQEKPDEVATLPGMR